MTIIVESAQRGTHPTCFYSVKPNSSWEDTRGGAKDAPRTTGVRAHEGSGPDAATTLTPSREREREREAAPARDGMTAPAPSPKQSKEKQRERDRDRDRDRDRARDRDRGRENERERGAGSERARKREGENSLFVLVVAERGNLVIVAGSTRGKCLARN